MISGKYNRKKFFKTLGTVTAGSVLATTLPVSSAYAETNSLFTGAPVDEYLFSEGLTYLNTGTIGPCRKDTIGESLKMWEQLESFPVKFYGVAGAESFAEKTREIASRFMGCDIDEMMITHSTTNGMNAIAQGLRLSAGDRILVTDQEHSGGLHCWEYYAKYMGIIVDKVSIPPGENNAEVMLERIKEKLKKKPRLISVSHVLSSTGLRMPIAEISSIARANGTLCIVDGAQAAGGIYVNVKELGCHAYATSGHKWLMGPKGTGLLYISKDARDLIRPMQFEESHKTYNNGNGVVDLACILGLGKAIEYLDSIGIRKVEEHNLSLRNKLYSKLKDVPNSKILSPVEGSLASPMLTLLLPDQFKKNAFVKMLLDKHKLAIRPTHNEFGFNGIRFSCHIFNNEKQIDFAGEAVRKELTT